MKKTQFIVIFFSIILEILSAIFFLKNENFNLFLSFHFMIICILYLSNYKYFQKKNDHYDIFAIFFPIFGLIFLLLHETKIVSKKLFSEIEEEGFEKDEMNLIKRNDIELHESKNLLGAFDSLIVEKSKEKKEMILKSELIDLKTRVEFFKKALKDEDMEVIHYAATEINKLDEMFQKKIKILSSQTGKEKELLNEYIKYCESGLLSDVVLKYYNQKVKFISEEIEEGQCLKFV
ncbi:MAG: hypothetical protein ACRC6Z_07675 [Cetobacterium sp.]